MTIYQLCHILETLSILKMFKRFVFYENNKVLYLSSTNTPFKKKSVFWLKILKDLLLFLQSGI